MNEKFKVLFKLFIIKIILFWGSQLATAKSLSDHLKSPEWRLYVECLVYFQKIYPAVYPPLELLRIDRISVDSLTEQIKVYSLLWRDHSTKDFRIEKVQNERLSISRKANDALELIVQEAKKKSPLPITGSYYKALISIPEKMRQALTPLDSVFKGTPLGEKLSVDSATRSDLGIEAATYDLSAKTFTLEGLPDSWQNLATKIPPQAFLKIKVEKASSDTLRLKSRSVTTQLPIGTDLNLQKDLMRGQFFNQKDPSPFPFGAYPKETELFKKEGNSQHFSGDGHSHAN